LIDPYRPASSI